MTGDRALAEAPSAHLTVGIVSEAGRNLAGGINGVYRPLKPGKRKLYYFVRRLIKLRRSSSILRFSQLVSALNKHP